ncbi:unnamed protein product [Scytosiphon promiscuus]
MSLVSTGRLRGLQTGTLFSLRGVSSKAGSIAATSASPAGSRAKILVLGTGWGGFRFSREVDKKKYDVTVVSPRNHFLFTPLLPSTTVGTLEFRCIQEPVRTIKGLKYLQAHSTGIDFKSKTIRCREVFKGTEHDLDYDYLVIATGAQNNTFGIPGVSEENHVFFLKQLGDARNIRNRLLECFERAASPFVSEEERSRLLSFVVVGGGPTSIEYAAELHDFLTTDVKRWYPDLQHKVSVHLVEASDHIMGSFDEKLISYTTRLLENRKVCPRLLPPPALPLSLFHAFRKKLLLLALDHTGTFTQPDWRKTQSSDLACCLCEWCRGPLKRPWRSSRTCCTLSPDPTLRPFAKHRRVVDSFTPTPQNKMLSCQTITHRQVKVLLNTSVKSVGPTDCTLGDGRKLPFGLMVWSTGLAPIELVSSMEAVEKDRGRIKIDGRLRVPGLEGVFAMGDAAVDPANPLGPLAQVADQQGKYLAKSFSKGTIQDDADTPPFNYRHLGSMAQVGDWKAIADFKGIGGGDGGGKAASGPVLEGLLAFATWRSAYWTKTVSIANKALIPMHWFKAWAFGRDISRF